MPCLTRSDLEPQLTCHTETALRKSISSTKTNFPFWHKDMEKTNVDKRDWVSSTADIQILAEFLQHCDLSHGSLWCPLIFFMTPPLRCLGLALLFSLGPDGEVGCYSLFMSFLTCWLLVTDCLLVWPLCGVEAWQLHISSLYSTSTSCFLQALVYPWPSTLPTSSPHSLLCTTITIKI